MDRTTAIQRLKNEPYLLGHALGFKKLTKLNNEWIIDMTQGKEDTTLQAHRGSYKTTCVAIALAIIVIVLPNLKVMFMRKTDNDVKEIIAQVKKILLSQVMQCFVYAIYGIELRLTINNATEISTNLTTDPRGTAQLVAMGIGSSLTGKHFDLIFTDDIVNVEDRTSKAERERTKMMYQELQNILNRGGRIYNTGTPWHKDDAFCLMSSPKKYDCYSTNLMSDEEIADKKASMTASLFSANYELKHIASEDVIFENPQMTDDKALVEQGVCHIDASYGGSDYSVFTICHKIDGIYYVFGKMWNKHIDDCMDEIITYRKQFNAGRISCEDNGDKGYLAKALRQKGERTHLYHESTNKYLKITSYLKAEWKNIRFYVGTDVEYIEQILDYNENAEHDDAPDSLASIVRELWSRNSSKTSSSSGGGYFA